MNCQYATSVSEYTNSCGLGLYGGQPSVGVCDYCVKRGDNNEEFATAYKLQENKPTNDVPPSALEMGKNLAGSVKDWVAGGFSTATEKQLEARQAICESCEFWTASAFAGTGACRKCGCSTMLKLKLATAKCPIDKWGPVT